MTPARCDRCGTAVAPKTVLCPVCHALVGVLDGPTFADVDDVVSPPGSRDGGFDDDPDLLDDEAFNGPTQAMPLPRATKTSMALQDALDPPTERIKARRSDRAMASFEEPTIAHTPKKKAAPAPIEFPPLRGGAHPSHPRPAADDASPVQGARSPSARQPASAERPELSEPPPTDPLPRASADPFAPRFTAPIHHNGILRSATDAVILGDAGDIAGSLLIEQPGADVDDDFLTATTGAARRHFVPVQVYIGRDIAEALTPEVVLRVKEGVDVNWVPLSPFERFVVAEVDGLRPVARIQARMHLGSDDLKLALALLLDKGVVAPVGVALKQRTATPAPKASGQQVPKQPGAARPPTAWPSASAPFDPDDTLSAPPPLKPITPRPAPPAPRALVADVAEDGDNTAPAPAPAKGARSLLASMLDERPVKDENRGLHDRATANLRPAVARGDRLQAAQLHREALEAVKRGDVARGWQLACLAREADPDHARYKDTVTRWNDIVAGSRVADDARLYAQAIRKESLGDVAGALALLREVVQMNDQHAGAWNRLGLLLLVIEKDCDAAAAAFERAVALAPDDASYKNNLGKAADAAQRQGVVGVLRRLAGRRGP